MHKLLGVQPFTGPRARAVAMRIAREVSRVVNTRIDIINILIAELVRLDYEPPMFDTLVKIAEKEHEAVDFSGKMTPPDNLFSLTIFMHL